MSSEINNEPTSTKTLTMDELSANETFPEVKQNAIDAISEQKAETAAIEQAAPIKLKADGTPAKKRGRKAGSTVQKPQAQSFNNPRNPQGENVNQNIPNISSKQAAQVVSGLIEQLSVVLVSDDFIYSEIERNSNVQAWEQTLDYYGGVTISPPAALAMNHIAIIVSRSQKEKTKTKVNLIKAWISDKIASRFKKKKDKENALPNSGSDNVGENNVRKEESGKPKK